MYFKSIVPPCLSYLMVCHRQRMFSHGIANIIWKSALTVPFCCRNADSWGFLYKERFANTNMTRVWMLYQIEQEVQLQIHILTSQWVKGWMNNCILYKTMHVSIYQGPYTRCAPSYNLYPVLVVIMNYSTQCHSDCAILCNQQWPMCGKCHFHAIH